MKHAQRLAFSCKGRGFCPSCHQRKVQSTAARHVDPILLLDEDGTWHPAPEIPHRVLEELFRTKIFAELLRHKLISPELVARMKSWKHTGFNVDASRIVAPENRAEREVPSQHIPYKGIKMIGYYGL